MGKRGDKEIGNSNVQGSDSRRAKYLELSLQGRWIKLASVFIEDHSPCTVEFYMQNIVPLMPTHIKQKGRTCSFSQDQIADYAIRKIQRSGHVFIDNGVISVIKKTRRDVSAELLNGHLEPGMVIDVNAITSDEKQRHTVKSFLLRRGYVRVGKGRYQKIEPDRI